MKRIAPNVLSIDAPLALLFWLSEACSRLCLRRSFQVNIHFSTSYRYLLARVMQLRAYSTRNILCAKFETLYPKRGKTFYTVQKFQHCAKLKSKHDFVRRLCSLFFSVALHVSPSFLSQNQCFWLISRVLIFMDNFSIFNCASFIFYPSFLGMGCIWLASPNNVPPPRDVCNV